MAQTKNKYAFDREYYTNLAKSVSFDGNAARRLDVASYDEALDDEVYDESDAIEEYDEYEDYEEYGQEAYEEPEREEETEINVVQKTENETSKAPKTKYVVRFDLLKLLVLTCVFGVLTGSSVYLLRLQSEYVQMGKQITASEKVLSDASALNCSLRAKLDTSVDRNYIYNVAVGRLGMVFPDNNRIATYELADSDHVRQYGQFR